MDYGVITIVIFWYVLIKWLFLKTNTLRCVTSQYNTFILFYLLNIINQHKFKKLLYICASIPNISCVISALRRTHWLLAWTRVCDASWAVFSAGRCQGIHTQMTWGRQQCSEQMWAQHLTLWVCFKGHLHSEI